MTPDPDELVVAQREDAAAEGWHRSKGKDICPECWEEGVRG